MAKPRDHLTLAAGRTKNEPCSMARNRVIGERMRYDPGREGW